MPAIDRVDVPYLRAGETVAQIRPAGDLATMAEARADERLREQEFVILDRLTRPRIEQKYPRQRVLIVAHQAVGLRPRYLLEILTEQEILAIDHQADVANCGITSYHLSSNSGVFTMDQAPLQLVQYNFVAPLLDSGAPVTSTPAASGVPR